jgi:RNA polymerase sigma-54 factor
MRIGPSLILATRQTLAMTPQLQQAIKLLQFSHLELAAYIQQELEKNPLLSEGSSDEGPIGEPDPMPVEAPVDTAEALAAAAPALAEVDDRWTREYADRGGDGAAGKGAQREDAPDALDFVAERPRSLAMHVLEQIDMIFTDAAESRLALKLAEGLDEAGYCRLDPVTVAQAVGQTLEFVERVWARLRQIEPAGLFARTLGECLAAQLAERDRLDPAMRALLDNLDLVAAGELGQLRRRCGVDEEDLRDMLTELRTLDPRPGQAFDFEPLQPVVPDIYLTPARDPDTGEEGWHIELNSDALPKVLVDRNYHATLMKGTRAKSDRDFVAERFQSANWLVKTLEQRATTILKVAREIVRQQDGFFHEGVSALKPLVLRDIAIATELHESTVSRVTSNKYMATPRGIFELKYFFTSSLPGRAPGAVVSSEAVRSRIRLLIGAESAQQPLSDDRIVDLLSGEGVEIARRTVAKYREAMRIPSSAERRRLGRLGMGRAPSVSLSSGHPAAAPAPQAMV